MEQHTKTYEVPLISGFQMLHWNFLLGLWKGREDMPDITPTTQCNTNNPAALVQNSTGANLHPALQISYGHNSCDRKEKAHSFFSSWSILGYISFLRCKETCLVLSFFTKWVGRREKESSGTFEILFYKELGKLISCSCSNLANFLSSNELRNILWTHEISIQLCLKFIIDLTKHRLWSTELQGYWVTQKLIKCYLGIYVGSVENWRNAPPLVLNPVVCRI